MMVLLRWRFEAVVSEILALIDQAKQQKQADSMPVETQVSQQDSVSGLR